MTTANVNLTSYLLSGIIVSIPAILLTEFSDTRYAWYYVGLIILMLLIFYSDAFKSFFSSLRSV